MKLTIIAATQEIFHNGEEMKNSSKTLQQKSIEFGGKQAGICYMGESYFDSAVTDTLKAVKRFHTTIGNDHHSIIDHCKVTILFEGISKMLAMVLNSLQDYCTSEKSGRYTIMTSNNPIEKELYEKWSTILVSRIKTLEPSIDDKLATKLAQENARYFLSVFTRSTTMSYTTSYRQWNYIIDWCKNYIETHQPIDGEERTFFENELYSDISELYSSLMNISDLYIPELRDPNNRHFSFLARQVDDIMGYSNSEYFGDVYKTIYSGSFVQLAQAQRHRTLKYFMQFNGIATKFYVPTMLWGTANLSDEWLNDMLKVADRIPQGTLVDIVEMGYIGDFFLKCRERLCGRAQHEIMHQICETLTRMLLEGEFSTAVQNELLKYIGITEEIQNISPKCVLRYGCKEPCMHGAKNALSRLF